MWSIVLYGTETWKLRRNEQKQLEAFEMWISRRMERVKNKEEEKKLTGPLAKKELPAEGYSRRNS